MQIVWIMPLNYVASSTNKWLHLILQYRILYYGIYTWLLWIHLSVCYCIECTHWTHCTNWIATKHGRQQSRDTKEEIKRYTSCSRAQLDRFMQMARWCRRSNNNKKQKIKTQTHRVCPAVWIRNICIFHLVALHWVLKLPYGVCSAVIIGFQLLRHVHNVVQMPVHCWRMIDA